MSLSWTPRLHGDRYCSPACGAGCTKSAFDRATGAAKKLAERLGKGWKPRVWENLGWHYAVISPCGRWKIHPHVYQGKAEGYTAFLGESTSPGGIWAEHGDTPEEAIAKTRKVAQKHLQYYADILNADMNA